MGKVRRRKETGRLVLDFNYLNLRCREQTLLMDTPANRKTLVRLLEKIEAEIVLGCFDYASYFPQSKMLAKLGAIQGQVVAARASTPTLREFAQSWYGEMEVTWRESYKATVYSLLFNRIVTAFGERRLDEITKAEILQFRAQLGKVKRENGSGLSAEHINRHIKVLRMLMEEASDRFSFTSPCLAIKPLKKPKSDVDPFTTDEINRILASVRADYRDYYTVRFFTGMRSGEIDGLKWRYVDFDARQILIRETWVGGRNEYTKTDSSQREIVMSALVADALKRQQQATGTGEYVFCTRSGTPLSHNNVTKRVWYPLLAHLGLRKRRPYQTRHTAATLWLASGENPEWIARQMGHANTEMLFRVYSRYVPNLTRKDGSAFEHLVSQHININKESGDD